jgi:hypothetical protein
MKKMINELKPGDVVPRRLPGQVVAMPATVERVELTADSTIVVFFTDGLMLGFRSDETTD